VAAAGECAEEEVLFLGLPAGGITLPDVHLAPPPASGVGTQRPTSSLAQHKEPGSQTAASAATALSAAAGLPVAHVPAGSSSSTFTFTIANNSSNKHFRYKWPEHPQLRFYPSVGHLHAGQSRDVTVTFVASSPVKLDNQDIKVALSQITYKVKCAPSLCTLQQGAHPPYQPSFLCCLHAHLCSCSACARSPNADITRVPMCAACWAG
jgi:hypothetical protein